MQGFGTEDDFQGNIAVEQVAVPVRFAWPKAALFISLICSALWGFIWMVMKLIVH